MTDDPPTKGPNHPWRDLLVALAIPYLVLAVYAAVQFASPEPLWTTLALVMLVPLTLFLLGAQMSPLAVGAVALFGVGAVVLAVPMRSFLRVPVLVVVVLGLAWIAGSTGVFVA